jgi:hypothetical protein
MAVYERNYRPYSGPLTPQGTRWMVLVRFARQEIFRSRMFTLFFILCFITPVFFAAVIYLHHNMDLIEKSLPGSRTLLEQIARAWPIDASMFHFELRLQTSFAFLVILAAAPSVVAPDLRNNGLALFLSRPLSRTEYAMGKLIALVWPVSLMTWGATLADYLLQVSLTGWSWFIGNLRIAFAIIVGGLTWSIMLALLGLTIAAWVKWRPIARIVLLIVLFMPVAFAGVVEGMLNSWWGELFSPTHLVRRAWEGLFGLPPHSELPLALAWFMICLCFAVCGLLLRRRIRAYEIVR